MQRFNSSGEIAWRPTPELAARSNLWGFMERHGIASLSELQRRSTSELEWFWESVLRDLDIRFEKPYVKVLDLSNGIESPEWCKGGQLNIIHNCLDKYAGTATDHKVALRWETESAPQPDCALTYFQLRCEVNKAANYFRQLGLGKGQVVGVFMPMVPECVVTMLAIIKIGAIFLPLFSGFAAAAVASRLADADAVALVTVESFQRRGRPIEIRRIAEAAAAQAKSVRQVIVAGSAVWNAQSDAAPTESTAAEDVLMVLYTSGTTGRPKGTVHTHCGFPVKAAQDIWMGLDLHADETLFWVTDMGWMMGPWQVFGTLLLGATMMLYDGAPDWPDPFRVWELVETHKVTALGISPTLVRSLMRFAEEPVRRHDLSSLRKFASTGEAWNPDPWLWLLNVIGGGRLPIINYSGGTEISGGILMGNVLTPLKPCAFAGPLPGMAADVVNERGESVRGEVGELILREPWIGMTRGFWRDPQRYEETYWSRFPGLWVHGDYAAIDADGMWYILGRSDDTIKVAGKRLGPAEVESVLVEHQAVVEAAAIGVPDPLKGSAVICFCVLKPGAAPSPTLRAELLERVAAALGKPLTPRDVLFVADLPKTRNAKVMRRLIRAAYLGEPLGDISALENPSAVEAIPAAPA
jgi:acetyl-CoA synthetase